MHTKTMEGLVGASTNMELLNTPFRAYKEARRRGDTAGMERAMGYVGDCAERAEEYRTKAEEGMEEDAKEAREKAQAQRENAIRKRKEEREELDQRIEESKNVKTDTVEISEDGKAVWNENAGMDQAEQEVGVSAEAAPDSILKPVIYTKTGEASQNQSESNTNISVSV